MSLYRGTTPTYTITFPNDINMEIASNIVVSLANPSKVTLYEKKGDDLTVEGNKVSFLLTQEESLGFPLGYFLLQVNWLYVDGSIVRRACSKMVTVQIADNLKDEVM